MHFFKRGQEYAVTRITGISDCFLSVDLGVSSGGIALEPVDQAAIDKVEAIKEGILLGIADFNQAGAGPISVRRVKFAAADGGSPEDYRRLVLILLHRATSGEPFEGTT